MLRAIGGFLKELLWPSQSTSLTGKLLPESIRNALATQKGRLFPKDLQILATRSGYADVLIYLVAKILHDDPLAQFVFMGNVVRCAAGGVEEEQELATILLAAIGELNPARGVSAVKLLQLNRQGFELWDEKYQQTAQQYAKDSSPLVVIAYATLVGLRQIVHAYQGKGADIFIVNPHLVADFEDQRCGYRIFWEGAIPHLDVLPKTYAWPEALIVLDDTSRHGTTIGSVFSFLVVNGLPGLRIEEVILDRVPPVAI